MVCYSWRNTGNGAGGGMRFNGDTGSNYSYRGLRGLGTTVQSYNSTTWVSSYGTQYDEFIWMHTCSSASTSDTFNFSTIYIPNYAGSTNKSISVEFASENNGAAAEVGAEAGLWSNTAAITSITFLPDVGYGNIKSGSSFYLFGITKS